jgi:hypothetical protein
MFKIVVDLQLTVYSEPYQHRDSTSNLDISYCHSIFSKKEMDVNEHERLSSFTLGRKLK